MTRVFFIQPDVSAKHFLHHIEKIGIVNRSIQFFAAGSLAVDNRIRSGMIAAQEIPFYNVTGAGQRVIGARKAIPGTIMICHGNHKRMIPALRIGIHSVQNHFCGLVKSKGLGDLIFIVAGMVCPVDLRTLHYEKKSVSILLKDIESGMGPLISDILKGLLIQSTAIRTVFEYPGGCHVGKPLPFGNHKNNIFDVSAPCIVTFCFPFSAPF